MAGGYCRSKSIITSLSSKIIVDVSTLLCLFPQPPGIDGTILDIIAILPKTD